MSRHLPGLHKDLQETWVSISEIEVAVDPNQMFTLFHMLILDDTFEQWNHVTSHCVNTEAHAEWDGTRSIISAGWRFQWWAGAGGAGNLNASMRVERLWKLVKYVGTIHYQTILGSWMMKLLWFLLILCISRTIRGRSSTWGAEDPWPLAWLGFWRCSENVPHKHGSAARSHCRGS